MSEPWCQKTASRSSASFAPVSYACNVRPSPSFRSVSVTTRLVYKGRDPYSRTSKFREPPTPEILGTHLLGRTGNREAEGPQRKTRPRTKHKGRKRSSPCSSFLSASGPPTSSSAAAQLAHIFFKPLYASGQSIEALVDPLPVPLFALAPYPRASCVPASLATGSYGASVSRSLGAALRDASVSPIAFVAHAPSSAHRRASRSVIVQCTLAMVTLRGFWRNRYL